MVWTSGCISNFQNWQRNQQISRGLFVIFVFDSISFRNSTIFVKFSYILCKFNGHSLNLCAFYNSSTRFKSKNGYENVHFSTIFLKKPGSTCKVSTKWLQSPPPELAFQIFFRYFLVIIMTLTCYTSKKPNKTLNSFRAKKKNSPKISASCQIMQCCALLFSCAQNNNYHHVNTIISNIILQYVYNIVAYLWRAYTPKGREYISVPNLISIIHVNHKLWLNTNMQNTHATLSSLFKFSSRKLDYLYKQ